MTRATRLANLGVLIALNVIGLHWLLDGPRNFWAGMYVTSALLLDWRALLNHMEREVRRGNDHTRKHG